MKTFLLIAGGFLGGVIFLAIAASVIFSALMAYLSVAGYMLEGGVEDFVARLDQCVVQNQCASDSKAHKALDRFAHLVMTTYGEAWAYNAIWVVAFVETFRSVPKLVAAIISTKLWPVKPPTIATT